MVRVVCVCARAIAGAVGRGAHLLAGRIDVRTVPVSYDLKMMEVLLGKRTIDEMNDP